MNGIIAWSIAIGASVSGLALTAAYRAADVRFGYAHLAIAAAVCIFFALAGIRASRALLGAGASHAAVAASNARHMGLVWAWGALGLVVTYGTGIQSWKEWLSFFAAFLGGAGLCLFFANVLARDAAAGRSDDTMMKVANHLSMAQLVGMILVMVGLVVDGKMIRFLEVQRPRSQDWAANGIFFFGALALAALSAHALRSRPGRGA
jgi:hypothetical protein